MRLRRATATASATPSAMLVCSVAMRTPGTAGRVVAVTGRLRACGRRRRLDLAAALVHRPPVLFLDEPTTGLDPKGRNDLWAVIGELVADGTTLLLTTQYLEEADRLADRIVVIDGGRVIAEGSASELKAQIGTTVVEVRLGDTRTAQEAAGLLGPIGATELLDDKHTVSVSVTDSGRALLEVVRLLENSGQKPESLIVREPTLDDVFLRLTGHAASTDPPSESPTAGAPGGTSGGAK